VRAATANWRKGGKNLSRHGFAGEVKKRTHQFQNYLSFPAETAPVYARRDRRDVTQLTTPLSRQGKEIVADERKASANSRGGKRKLGSVKNGHGSKTQAL